MATQDAQPPTPAVRAAPSFPLTQTPPPPQAELSSIAWPSHHHQQQLRPRPQQIPDIRGRHRKQAELTRLNQEIRLLEKELEDLATTDYASVACKQLIMRIESTIDPLLSRTQGSENAAWNRWFEQPIRAQKGCWRC